MNKKVHEQKLSEINFNESRRNIDWRLERFCTALRDHYPNTGLQDTRYGLNTLYLFD